MKRAWMPLVPLNIKPDDMSADACEMRLTLYQGAFALMRGRGFRLAPGTASPKRKKPRRGWAPVVSRIETLYIHARYGERHEPAV